MLKIHGRAANYVSSGVNVRNLASPKGSIGLSMCAKSFWQGRKLNGIEASAVSPSIHTTVQDFPSYLRLME